MAARCRHYQTQQFNSCRRPEVEKFKFFMMPNQIEVTDVCVEDKSEPRSLHLKKNWINWWNIFCERGRINGACVMMTAKRMGMILRKLEPRWSLTLNSALARRKMNQKLIPAMMNKAVRSRQKRWVSGITSREFWWSICITVKLNYDWWRARNVLFASSLHGSIPLAFFDLDSQRMQVRSFLRFSNYVQDANLNTLRHIRGERFVRHVMEFDSYRMTSVCLPLTFPLLGNAA